jgi:hypothetical protein
VVTLRRTVRWALGWELSSHAAACMGHRDRHDSQRHMERKGCFPVRRGRYSEYSHWGSVSAHISGWSHGTHGLCGPDTRAPNVTAVVGGCSSAATRGASDLRGDDTGLREPPGSVALVEPPAVRAPTLVGFVGLRGDASFSGLACATTGDANDETGRNRSRISPLRARRISPVWVF